MRSSSCRVRNSLRFLAVLLVASVALASSTTAQAQIARSWNATDGDWSVAINWLPNGVPGTLDGAFIGASAVAENALVTLDQDDTIAVLTITDGMRLATNGNQLTVNGNSIVSGFNNAPFGTFVLSRLTVTDSGGAFDVRTDNLTVSDNGQINLDDGVLQIDGVLTLEDDNHSGFTNLVGTGVINFTGSTGRVLINDKNIGGAATDSFHTMNQLGAGRLDLDGDTGTGRIDGSLTVNGTELADAFDGTMILRSGVVVNMNLSNGWTLGAAGLIRFGISPLSGGVVTQLNGSDVTVVGRILCSKPSQFNADAIFEPPSVIDSHDLFEFNGAVIINGGTFTTIEDANIDFNGATTIHGGTFNTDEGGNIDFNGPTTIHGGTFNTFSTNINDGDVDFNGPTTWAGDVTINGIAQQQGDATVSAASVITADAFDMDGSLSSTSWDINAPLEVHATRINSGSSTFNGTLDIGGQTSSRLLINVDSASQPEWTMAGTMNLGGIVIGIAFVDRLFGSRVIVTGEVNVVNRAGIVADAVFTSDSTLNFNSGAVSPVLRMSGRTTIEAGATLVGTGELENGVGGQMSLEAGLATGLVGVTNRGRLSLGQAVGVVSVDRFQNAADATLVVDVGRNTLGTNSDVLTISSGVAVLDGFLQPNVVHIGGTFQAPQFGDSFTILTAVGGVSGTFDQVLTTPHGGLIYDWDVTYNPSNVVIELATIGGLLGDYNGDGIVNAADYTVWRDTQGSSTNLAADGNLNGTIDQPDYNVWVANFGTVLGSGAFENVAVPEPASLMLLMLAALGATPQLRWRVRRS